MIQARYKKRGFAFKPPRRPIDWLNPVPMIDVVFLLLVFFMLSANFRGDEGFLPAALPQIGTAHRTSEMEPLLIYLESRPDGACQVQIGRVESFLVRPGASESDFQALAGRLNDILAQQGRRSDDPVKLVPGWHTRWDHVVKTYDALWRINLTNIIFAVVEPPA